MTRCTFVPNNRQVNLLCDLFVRYRSGRSTAETLRTMRDELGQEEFRNLESDLAGQMGKHQAWKATEIILRQALLRKRDDAAKRGVRPRMTQDKIAHRIRRAEELFQREREELA